MLQLFLHSLLGFQLYIFCHMKGTIRVFKASVFSFVCWIDTILETEAAAGLVPIRKLFLWKQLVWCKVRELRPKHIWVKVWYSQVVAPTFYVV